MQVTRITRLAALTGLVLTVIACGSRAPRVEVVTLESEPPQLDLPEVSSKLELKRTEPIAGNDPSAQSPLIDVMVEENARWHKVLQKKDIPAYYIAYHLHEQRSVTIAAESGALLQADDETQRALDVEVRVGTPDLDNRHPLRDDRLAFLQSIRRLDRVPFDDDKQAIQSHLWLATDRRYREAVDQLKYVATNRNVSSDGSRTPPDFSHEQPEVHIQKRAGLAVDIDEWTERARVCSRSSRRGVATRSTCIIELSSTTRYFVNSEGSRLQQSWTDARLTVSVGVKADDGMPLSRSAIHYTRSPSDLPTTDEIETMIVQINRDLAALHRAPVVDPYSGPAILQGLAAAVFFHEVFGHRIEGHRQKDESSGQTFSTKLNERIMPEWITVFDDPTISSINGKFANGFYHFDDEGVRAQRALLVERGVLKGFTMGRNPIEHFSRSNGHGRRAPGLPTVSRQGNLIVQAHRSVPDEELEKLLIDEINTQGKPHGMVFTDISGGFTNTSRFLPQSFKVNPIMAYRVYPDGRKELVRGVDIEGTPLIALGSIMAAGRETETFNGICIAESGPIPVSASAPSLLLRQVEVARGPSSSGSSPTLPPPSIASIDAPAQENRQ